MLSRLSIIGFISLIFFVSACHLINSKVAQVGSYAIYQRDVECRDAIIKLGFPGEERSLGLTQLIRAYQFAQILKLHGREVTADTLKKERQRIDEKTLFPEKLAEIKKKCGDGGVEYERAYLLPVLVERVLYYEFFISDPAVHAVSLEKPNRFLSQALIKPTGFAALAKKEGLRIAQLTVSLSTGLQWKLPNQEKNPPPPSQPIPAAVSQKFESQKGIESSTEGKKWVEELIKPLKPGELIPRIIDDRETWLVARYLKPVVAKVDTYELEVVSFPKRNFDEWLAQEVKLISIQK